MRRFQGGAEARARAWALLALLVGLCRGGLSALYDNNLCFDLNT